MPNGTSTTTSFLDQLKGAYQSQASFGQGLVSVPGAIPYLGAPYRWAQNVIGGIGLAAKQAISGLASLPGAALEMYSEQEKLKAPINQQIQKIFDNATLTPTAKLHQASPLLKQLDDLERSGPYSELTKGVVTLGAYPVLKAETSKDIQAMGGTPRTAEEQAAHIARVLGESAKEYFGYNTAKEVLTETNTSGPAQVAKGIQAGMEALPLLGLPARLAGMDTVRKLTKNREYIAKQGRNLVTEGELAQIEARKAAASAQDGLTIAAAEQASKQAIHPAAARLDDTYEALKAEAASKGAGQADNAVLAQDLLNEGPELLEAMRGANWWAIDNPMLTRLLEDTVATDLFKEMYPVWKSKDQDFNRIVSAALQSNALSPSQYAAYAKAFNLPPNKIAKGLALAVRSTAKVAGTTEKAFSDADRIARAVLAKRAMEGDSVASRAWTKIRDTNKVLRQAGTTPNGLWGALRSMWETGEAPAMMAQFNDITRWISSRRLRGMVTQPKTAVRNVESQGIMTGVELLEEGLGAAAEQLVNRLGGKGVVQLDLTDDLFEALHTINPARPNWQEFDSLLKAVPTLHAEMNSQRVTEFSNHITRNLVRDIIRGEHPVVTGMDKFGNKLSPGQHAVEIYDTALDIMNTANYAQEKMFRMHAARTRMGQNLRRLGFVDDVDATGKIQRTAFQKAEELLHKTPDQLNDLQKAQLENIKIAMYDSYDHALKMTLAQTPRDGVLFPAIMNMYKAAPILTEIAHPFPRFLANQWRYITEHSPVNFVDLLNPKFKKLLGEGNPDVFLRRDAQKHLTKAMSGLMMFAAAKSARDTVGGPKYYQLKLETDNPETLYDVRSVQPFVSMLFLSSVYDWLAHGIPLNLNSNEILDAMTGVRRASDTAVLAITDALRGLDLTDPDARTKALERIGGQYIGSWFIPVQAVRDMVNVGQVALNPKVTEAELSKIPDIVDQPLTGPTQQRLGPTISEAMGASPLVPRVDMFTGKDAEISSWTANTIGALPSRTYSDLERVAMNLGLSAEAQLPNYGTPEATNLVRSKMGEQFSAKLGDETVQAFIAKKLREIYQAEGPEVARTWYKEIFKEVNSSAYKAARAERPELFIMYQLKNAEGGELKQQLYPLGKSIEREALRNVQPKPQK